MLEEIVIAGFGGQGILFAGELLSYAGLFDNKEVSFMPSYGPEIRGGTANCVVIISSETISSPVLSAYDSALIFNPPSLERFESGVKKGGLLIWNKSLIHTPPSRKDIFTIDILADETAMELGSKQVANMVILGTYLKKKNIFNEDIIFSALKSVLAKHHKEHFFDINKKALLKGMELV